MKKLKIALFYDWLNQWGGAEKVLLSLIKLYPDAPIYTLVYDPSNTKWLPKSTKVIPSIINKLPFSKSNPIFYTPFYDITLEQFDFSSYDIVISTTSTIGHCLITRPTTLFVCYFHNINRHLYQNKFLSLYQKIDKIYSHRPDALICNSTTVSNRIQEKYKISPQIINPGIDTKYFVPVTNPTNDYFLIVSRFVPHKNIDLAINAFNINKEKLIIIGGGRQEHFLKTLAHNSKNITFVGKVSDEELLNYYQNCQALICPQLEDFGLSAIEAQSCGKPVIALGRGGNTETIINGKTGIFFEHPTVEDLLIAINNFKKKTIYPLDCQTNASRFSDTTFMLKFSQSIIKLWEKHTTTIS